jgi:hypothetical protein
MLCIRSVWPPHYALHWQACQAFLHAYRQPSLKSLRLPHLPSQSLEALYKKARKLRRGADALVPLVEAAQAEVSYLEEVGAV